MAKETYWFHIILYCAAFIRWQHIHHHEFFSLEEIKQYRSLHGEEWWKKVEQPYDKSSPFDKLIFGVFVLSLWGLPFLYTGAIHRWRAGDGYHPDEGLATLFVLLTLFMLCKTAYEQGFAKGYYKHMEDSKYES